MLVHDRLEAVGNGGPALVLVSDWIAALQGSELNAPQSVFSRRAISKSHVRTALVVIRSSRPRSAGALRPGAKQAARTTLLTTPSSHAIHMDASQKIRTKTMTILKRERQPASTTLAPGASKHFDLSLSTKKSSVTGLRVRGDSAGRLGSDFASRRVAIFPSAVALNFILSFLRSGTKAD